MTSVGSWPLAPGGLLNLPTGENQSTCGWRQPGLRYCPCGCGAGPDFSQGQSLSPPVFAAWITGAWPPGLGPDLWACGQWEQMPVTQSDLHWGSLQANNLPGGSWRDPGGSWREACAPRVARLRLVCSSLSAFQYFLLGTSCNGASELGLHPEHLLCSRHTAWASPLPEPRTVQGSCRFRPWQPRRCPSP